METYGHYRVVRKLGEGGMGAVYAAEDQRLGRTVAVKLIHKGSDAIARERLRREARAAASVNHPHICQIYDIGEEDGELFIAMELLEGESLLDRLSRGAIPLRESIEVMAQVLDALGALHERGIIHRDLKPSNIFLTTRGVKLLDFGLALPLGEELRLTRPGTIAGTPCYMAPEQWSGGTPVPQTDLFACGAILFEMLTGTQAFRGDTLPQLCHAVSFTHPPALTGGPEIEQVDRALHRALAKDSQQRFASAADMSAALLVSRPLSENTVRLQPVQAIRRLIVMPFRLLREDSEIDFLTLSLPDAITTSLCGIQALVVRSSRVAARYAASDPDPRTLAGEAEVDFALFGTLMRAGDQVRLKTQLVETPSGTLLWSRTVQAPVGDVFQLEDVLRDGVLESLAIRLTTEEQRRIEAAPPQAHAYELYLKANQIGFSTVSTSRLLSARDLLESSVREDPAFAPAWARLGRVYRIMSKYGHGDAKESLQKANEAFQRAFALSPDLPIAHSYYTYFELEELGRAPEAVLRLLGLVEKRTADAEIFAGLVTACRFAGLNDASIAASDRALRLDPTIRTSVHYTHFLNADYERAIAFDHDEICCVRGMSLIETGDEEAGVGVLRDVSVGIEGVEQGQMSFYLAVFEKKPAEAEKHARAVLQSGFHDPEGFFIVGRCLLRVGIDELALDFLQKSVEANFCCFDLMKKDAAFDRVRETPRFAAIFEDARLRTERARAMFVKAGGPGLLGL